MNSATVRSDGGSGGNGGNGANGGFPAPADRSPPQRRAGARRGSDTGAVPDYTLTGASDEPPPSRFGEV